MHKKKFRERKIFRACFYFVIIFTLTSYGVFPEAEDIYIKNHDGNLKMQNPKGGFLIDSVDGNCDVTTYAGPIKIGFASGDVVAITSLGDIEISEAKGNVKAISGGGNIRIKRAFGDVYAETVLGEITIDFAKSVEAKTILGGDIKIYDILEYAEVNTNSNILLVVNKETSGSYLCDLKSMVGDITLYLPKKMGANLEIKIPLSKDSSKENRIESDFPFSVLHQKHQDGQNLMISTSINKGGKKVKLFINKGDIYLKAIK